MSLLGKSLAAHLILQEQDVQLTRISCLIQWRPHGRFSLFVSFFFVGGGGIGGKWYFWGGKKNPKAYQKWLIFYFFLTGGGVGWGEPKTGGLPPLSITGLIPTKDESPFLGSNFIAWHGTKPREGYWPRKRVWGCEALKTPFSRLSCSSQGSHFKQKSQFTRPLLRKVWNFSLYSLNFHSNFSSQAPKFGNFQITSPQIWKCSVHKPPFQRQISVKPHTRKSRPHTPTWKKKLSAPPPRH